MAVIGPGQICVSKKIGRQTANKDFPRGQVNGFAENLDIKKTKQGDRLKINTADPSHFLRSVVLRIAPRIWHMP